MRRIILTLLTALAAFAAEDPWVKVRELQKDAELKIYKVNTKTPILARFDRASDESLIVVTKTGQESILKEDIERLDCRRERSPRPETRVERKVAAKGAEVTSNTLPGGTTSVKTGIAIPSKPAFEKIYERAPAGK
jgi:hypothetical protein